MSEANQLLVPIDGSKLALSAIPFAQALAGDAGSIVLFQVVPPAEPVRSELGTPIVSATLFRQWNAAWVLV